MKKSYIWKKVEARYDLLIAADCFSTWSLRVVMIVLRSIFIMMR